jgi:glutathione S-transferase
MSSVPKLYYTSTSCGMASFIAAHVAGLKIDSEQVDIRTHKTASGADYYSINPKGNVPALVLPGGVTLNEGAAVLQYIADQAPESGLAPKWGTVERYQLINLLNYVASEVHASFGPLFNQSLSAEAREAGVKKLYSKFDYLEKHVLREGKPFLLGDQFTVVDSYLYICLSWNQWLGTNMDGHPKLKAYFEGIKGLKAVQEANEIVAKAAKA